MPLSRPLTLALAVPLTLLTGCDQPETHRVVAPTDFAQAFLDAHNAVRANPTPPAEPALAPLAWSEEAAATAQAWADRCTWGHNPDRGPRGENLYASAPVGATTPADVVLGDPEDGFGGWATEAADYDHGSNACAEGKVCGHYTQLVWRDTVAVGCAKATCYGPAPFTWSGAWELWVCDYEPAGNVLGARPY